MEHPFLVPLEYCFYDDEKFYYVTPLMKGGDLFQHLQKERRFTESRFFVPFIANPYRFISGRDFMSLQLFMLSPISTPKT